MPKALALARSTERRAGEVRTSCRVPAERHDDLRVVVQSEVSEKRELSNQRRPEFLPSGVLLALSVYALLDHRSASL